MDETSGEAIQRDSFYSNGQVTGAVNWDVGGYYRDKDVTIQEDINTATES